jgi:class 3 adenylate cyclase
VFPVDPGGIADDVVKLADSEGSEEIFEEAGPDAVFAFLVELLEVVVGGLEGFGVG